jgi:hypothetical protein
MTASMQIKEAGNKKAAPHVRARMAVELIMLQTEKILGLNFLNAPCVSQNLNSNRHGGEQEERRDEEDVRTSG